MTDQHRPHTDHHRVPSDAHRPPTEPRLDALLPSEMAAKASDIGARKAGGGLVPTFVLAVLAGAFVALGAAFATTVTAGAAGVVPYGITRVLAGLAFSLGLILVIVGGAELFTGNNLLAMSFASLRPGTRMTRSPAGSPCPGRPWRPTSLASSSDGMSRHAPNSPSSASARGGSTCSAPTRTALGA